MSPRISRRFRVRPAQVVDRSGSSFRVVGAHAASRQVVGFVGGGGGAFTEGIHASGWAVAAAVTGAFTDGTPGRPCPPRSGALFLAPRPAGNAFALMG